MNCTVSTSLLYSWQEAKSRFLSSQLNSGHDHPPPAQPLPMIPGAGSIPVSTLCKMMDKLTGLTLPHFPPTSCLPAPPYHLLGFGSFTAESTGLSSGQVLGEMAVEHPEAARVHLANGHFCLVPWAERNGLPRKHVQKSLVTPTLSVSPESCASKAALLALGSARPSPSYPGISKVHPKHLLCWALWKREEG